MQQFFINSIENPQLSPDQIKQCSKVLRMRAHDQVRLVDQNGQGAIFSFEDDSLTNLKYVEAIEFDKGSAKITLIASMIRNERMEWMIQKACELGVDKIVLYSAEHGVVKDFGQRTERKLERLNTIALEACEQAYRDHAVEVEGVINAKDLDKYLSEQNLYADVKPLPHIYKQLKGAETISIIIGPEGGFSDKERQNFEHLGFEAVSLGKNVLRAETASMVACNLINAFEVIS